MPPADKPAVGLALWLILVVLTATLSLAKWPADRWLAADFQALLPSTNSNVWIAQANEAVAGAYTRQVLWMVEGADSAAVNRFIADLTLALEDSGFSDPMFEERQSSRWRSLSTVLYPHRWGLLSPADRSILEHEPEAYFREFRRILYSPLGGSALALLESDPSGLYSNFMVGAAPNGLEQSMLHGENGKYSELAAVSIRPERLGFDSLADLYNLYQVLKREAREQNLDLYATGAPLYSAYGVHSAKFEMSTIGTVSLISLVGLLLWALGSVNAVFLTLLCVLSGVAGGLVFTVVMLKQIHVLTLVFGATLIGIAADYALHYFCHALTPGWTRSTALPRVYKGLLFGMLSTVGAFGALVVLPFPGIAQIGLFMASGLLCSFLTVCLLYPAAFRRAPAKQVLPRFCRQTQWLWRRSGIPLVLLLVTAAAGVALLPVVDDVRTFYAAPTDLKESEAAIFQRVNSQPDSRYLLLRAGSEDELLELEEQVVTQLRLLRDEGVLDRFSGITQLIPASTTQRDNYALLRRIDARGVFRMHMETLGFHPSAVQASRADLLAGFSPVGLAQLSALELPLGTGGFLGCSANDCASWLRLSGVHALAPLQLLADQRPGLMLVDPIADINEGMGLYRNAVAGMLLFAAALVLGLLSIAAGWRTALRIVLLPALACLLSLLVTGLLQGAYSLVNLMALLLIMGVSLDYAIFRAFTLPEEQPATTLAITLSALTSTLAFGMLSFSSTPVISGFGQTIALGLVFAYGLSWLRFETGVAA